MEAALQFAYRLRELRHRAVDHGLGNDLPDRQRANWWSGNLHLAEPCRELLGRARIDDASESHPAVGSGAHRTMLAGGEHGRLPTFLGAHVRRGPARNLELGVTRLIAAGHVVVVLEEDGAVGRDEHRAERLVARRQRRGRKLHAAEQVTHVHIVHHCGLPRCGASAMRRSGTSTPHQGESVIRRPRRAPRSCRRAGAPPGRSGRRSRGSWVTSTSVAPWRSRSSNSRR